MPDSALDDVRVIDLSQGIGGPYCGKLLAECGATVIKVEPPEGDYCRRLGPFPDDVPHHDKGGLFIHLNGGKKGVTLDIETESGRAVLRKLLAGADALIESETPGRMAALGLSYDDLKADHPELVYCSVTPFGQTGPYAGYKGNSLTALALCGLMYVTGDPDKEPLATGGEAAEYFAGINGWIGVLAALEHRAREGGGQHVDVSTLDSLGSADEYNTAMYASYGAIRKRFYSRHHFPAYPAEIYPCRDGHIVVSGGTAGWPLGMAILLERIEMETDAMFINPWMRLLQWQKFEEILRPYLLEHDWRDLLTRAQELRMPFGPVMSPKMLLEDEHMRERAFFAEVEQPEAGRLRVPGPPFKMSETPPTEGPAPGLGGDNDELLSEAGYDSDDQRVLRERGVT